MLVWEYSWTLLCSWTPKPFNFWRLFILKTFGCTIHGNPFVHQRARIEHPWNLSLGNTSSIGDRTHLYCLASIKVHDNAIIAQEAYLCTGTHDFSDPVRPLQTAPIEVGADCFVGCRAFILPGVIIGNGSIIGACSVVTRSVDSFVTVAGCPARVTKTSRSVTFFN